MTRPWDPMVELQDFVGVERNITERSFNISEDRDVPCFIERGREDCLGSGKGRSLEKNFDPEVTRALHALFKPFDVYFASRILERPTFHWSFGLNQTKNWFHLN